MLRFHAEKLVLLSNTFAKALAAAEKNPNQTLPKQTAEDIPILALDALSRICKEVKLNFSVLALESLREQLLFRENEGFLFISRMEEINNRIHDELATYLIMAIPQRRVEEYYENLIPFGQRVADNFPSANFDIEESGKCFTLARYTACVMHLQRTLEIGLKSYGNYLGVMNLITTAQPSWNLVLDQTRREIKERNDRNNNSKIWTLNEEKEFCENIQPFLEAVRTAWRNPSMHADAKYTEDEAEDIFNAVKRFMRNLAEHLDEAGTFTA